MEPDQPIELVGRDVVGPAVAEVQLLPARRRPGVPAFVDNLYLRVMGDCPVGERRADGVRDALADRVGADDFRVLQEFFDFRIGLER